jgi:hypothetical protein
MLLQTCLHSQWDNNIGARILSESVYFRNTHRPDSPANNTIFEWAARAADQVSAHWSSVAPFTSPLSAKYNIAIRTYRDERREVSRAYIFFFAAAGESRSLYIERTRSFYCEMNKIKGSFPSLLKLPFHEIGNCILNEPGMRRQSFVISRSQVKIRPYCARRA